MSLGVLVVLFVAFVAVFDALSRSRQREGGQGTQTTPRGEGAPGGTPDTRVRLPGAGGPRPAAQRPGLPRSEESAQVLLPDELWAILTGESRPTTARPTLPAPDEEPDDGWEAGPDSGDDSLQPAGRDRETREEAAAGAGTESSELTTLTGEPLELRSREGRELVVREERELILRPRAPIAGREQRELRTYDDEIPTDRERHDAFHRRLEAAAAGTGKRATAAERRVARRRQLQRAIIMREVLGPPRGLEDGL